MNKPLLLLVAVFALLALAAPDALATMGAGKADDAKPPKMTSAGAILAIIAAVKNSSAVINSGRSEVAHSTIVMPTMTEGRKRG